MKKERGVPRGRNGVVWMAWTLCLLAVSCGARPPVEVAKPRPPPVPPGFATTDEVMAAVMAGKVALTQTPTSIPDEVIEQKDVEYGKEGDRALLLDLYRPKKEGAKPVPGLILIHGGGWEGGKRDDVLFYAVYYAQKGYVAASISYRFSQEAPFPAAVCDTNCAIRWMRSNAAKYNVEANKIVAIGGSAGAYLAMMAGYAPEVREFQGDGGNAGVSSRVQGVVDLYGPPDLTIPMAQEAPVVKAFLGKTFAEAPELYTKASPITYLKAGAPPTLIIHGTIDETVPVTESDKLAEKLKALGVPCTYDRVPGWPHTMDLAAEINERILFFVDRFLAQCVGEPK